MLIDGKWSADWHPFQKSDENGRFVRQASSFRNWITPTGEPGPEGQPGEKAEAGRYHLFVNYICPWAGRTLIARSLKKLEDIVSVSVLEPVLSSEGWRFGTFPGASGPDTETGAQYLHQIYTKADPGYSGRASVPVLWDRKRQTIVNNESADILRIFDKGFESLTGEGPSLRPDALRPEIAALNQLLYEGLNNGVYKAGFAKSQSAYEEAVVDVFATLDALETRLSDGRPYLTGNEIVESDIRLFVTLARFDLAYVDLFKCNLKTIREHVFLSRYLERLYGHPAFGGSVHPDHIKAGYYSIKALNPGGLVPMGPLHPFGQTAVPHTSRLDRSAA
ncbi:glutathione S-transferase family protein [Roseibium sp. Sym1]|uniref:glutathione S-transferase family protein n=1 Tax=Roseibium sp. Sym1 TaxID=3016006 RepID=UPI0022B3B428|nr:glutathione S-transferase C-terminal domain-containing protein [Roseibium sp. Sym1]